MLTFNETTTLLLPLAAVVTAVGILWRGIVKPARKATRAITDLFAQQATVLTSVQELTALVARQLRLTDARLVRLEEMQDLAAIVLHESDTQRESRLAQQLAWDLAKIDRRRTHEGERRAGAS